MPYDRVRSAKKKVIGAKQTTKAIQKDLAKVVYVAKDAESRVTRDVVEMSAKKRIPVVMVDSMAELGKACGIQVGAALAAIVQE